MKARQFPRFAVEAEVALIGPDSVTRTGRTRNLSKGGLCADIDGSLETGTECRARVSLVFSDDAISEPLEVTARVCWCTQIGDQYQIGLVFTRPSAQTQTYLDMFLRFLEEAEEQDSEVDGQDLFTQRSR